VLLSEAVGQDARPGHRRRPQKGSFRIVKFVTSKVTLHENPPIDQIVKKSDPTQ